MPAFPPPFPLINGFYPSWAEISLSLDILDISDFKAVSWDDAAEVGDVYGAGPVKQGTTRGVSKPGTPKIEVYLDAADNLEETLASLSSDGRSVALAQFSFQLQWLKADNTYAQVNFAGCRVIKLGQDSKQGPEAEFRSFELNVTQITRVSHGVERGLLLSGG